ncbi:MAG: hypothetical protein WAT93_14665 [Pontixanthobacter sp.]
MLKTYITIDTELSSGAYQNGWGRDFAENFARTIRCDAGGQQVGIFHQMDVMDRYGVKGVFFVDPMAALVWGQRAVVEIVEPILMQGHEVQLHCHTEWLALAGDGLPLELRGVGTGQNIKDFTLDDQIAILDYAIERLVEAGAPRPEVFRAGNYGANDDTLAALRAVGVRIDTSFAAALDGPCDIGLQAGNAAPQMRCGMLEMPIAALASRNGTFRHAQITSISAQEMIAALVHGEKMQWDAFVMVSHSFELFNRQSGKANAIVLKRFERICRFLGDHNARFSTPPMRDFALQDGSSADYHLLPHQIGRTGWRMAEQAVANALYG